jgi:adenosylcobyric acid synthase
VPASGYEIHHGRIARGGDDEFLGGARAGHVFGTMWHGSLESDGLRRAFLAAASEVLGRPYEPSDVSFAERRDARLDLLGDLVEQKLDVEALLALVEHGAPAGLDVLPPGVG